MKNDRILKNRTKNSENSGILFALLEIFLMFSIIEYNFFFFYYEKILRARGKYVNNFSVLLWKYFGC